MRTKNIYALPYRKGVRVKAISDPRVHFAHFQYAIDFILPKGTKILAAKSGTVVNLKVNSNKGGADLKYVNQANYIMIKHTNNEYSYYAHLKHKGALVKIGDKVKKGQPIALSGNTGCSTAPHLHFCVLILTPNIGAGWETLEIVFKEEVSVFRPVIPEEELKKSKIGRRPDLRPFFLPLQERRMWYV